MYQSDYIPDYNELHDRYEAEQQRQLDKLPKCSCCGEPIQDDFCFEINDELICEDCLNTYHRKSTDDYIE